MSRPVILRFVGDDTSLTQSLGRVTGEVGKTNTALQSFGRFSDGLVATGRTLSTWITLPAIGAGVAAVKMAADYQHSVNKLRALDNMPAPVVAKWSQQILDFSRQVPQSATELANALYFSAAAFATSGRSGKDAMDVVKASAKAATAGLGDVAQLTDVLTSAMLAYAPGALKAQQATDIMVRTVVDGKMPAEQLATSLGRVLAPASALGISFDQVGAAIASMSHRGLDAFSSTTALRGIFADLLKPAAGVEKTFKSIGLSSKGLREELKDKGLLATLTTLTKASKDNPSVLAHMIPNVRALTGFLAMMGAGKGQTESIFKDIANSHGATQKAFAVMQQDPLTQFKTGLNSLKTSMIQFGNALMPTFVKLSQHLAQFAAWLGKLSPHMRGLIINTLGFAAAIGPVLSIFGHLGQLMTLVAENPLIAAVALLTIGFAYLYTHSKRFHDEVNRIGMDVVRVFQPLGQLIGNIMGDIVGWYTKHGASVKKNLIDLWTQVQGTLKAAMTAIAAVVHVAVEVILGFWQRFGQHLLTHLMTAFNAIMQALKGVFQIMKGIFEVFAGLLTFKWGLLWKGLKDIFGGLWNVILGVVKYGINLLSTIIGAGMALISEAWAGVWEGMKETAGHFLYFIVNDILKHLVNAFLDAAGGMVNAAAKAFGWVPEIGGKLKGAAAAIDQFKSSTDATMQGWANDMYQWGSSAGQNVGQGLADGMTVKQRAAAVASMKLAHIPPAVIHHELQIHSPSRVMQKLGEWTLQGFIDGLRAKNADLLAVTTTQAMSLVQRYTDSLSKVAALKHHLALVLAGHDVVTHSKKHGTTIHHVAPTAVAADSAKMALASAMQSAKELRDKLLKTIAEEHDLSDRRKKGKPLLDLAAKLTGPFLQQVIDAKGPVTKAADLLAEAIRKQFGDKNGKVGAAAQAAIANLQALAAKATAFHASFAADIHKGSDLVSKFGGTGATGADMQAYLQQKVAQIKAFASNLHTLAQRGLPASLLEQIAQGGLDQGSTIAAALVNSSSSELSSILSLQSQIDSLSQSTASAAEADVYGGPAAKALGKQIATGDTKNYNVTVNAQTNADPNAIAQQVMWLIKTQAA